MSQHCPHCHQPISPPLLSRYEDFFTCPHCEHALVHHETDIVLYALAFILIVTVLLVLLAGINSFIAMASTMLLYHFLRPRWFEPHFRLRIAKCYTPSNFKLCPDKKASHSRNWL
ncbi:hypothetical protein C9J03_21835 [Photobacterium gaetbulicola]|uniref:Uncharacterized protein n=1 Tax=Photobacterium gaetbulicola Gung47 TaxID=658445 RepID=A0A0C5WND7_9GAMM|nr:hypothetical protein [Photobacterium gaetbulicola]AJR07847.1 hypothetical protein H744_2c1168 [Photobacterium gaetbulicola Gung47]PSU03200.1 hypothetical protein C9J03_21835 [Photobacterium gaetbulicola]